MGYEAGGPGVDSFAVKIALGTTGQGSFLVGVALLLGYNGVVLASWLGVLGSVGGYFIGKGRKA